MLTRVISAIVVIAIVLFCMITNTLTRVVFIALIGFIGCHEILNAFKKGGYQVVSWPAYAFWIGSVASILLGLPVEMIMMLIVLLVMGMFIQRCLSHKMTNRELFASLSPIFYPLLFFVMIMEMIWEETTYWPMIFVLGVSAVVLCDTFALFVGRRFGKHKLTPISPKKTVEGLVGGLVFGTLSGAIVYVVLNQTSLEVMSLPFCLISAFFASLVGVFGDLAASSVKREASIKDYSKLIPGHGGIMDRVDSAIFAIPMVYVIYQIALYFI